MTAPPPPIDSLTDRDLVARYVRRRDELAFAALVRRHSSLVLGVCQRVLAHSHDVEDAFQATFLVLARDAQRVRKRDSLASWLHGVAYRTSLRAAESRHRRIRLLQDVTMIEDTSLADVEHRHRRQLLDEELQSLPEKYRAPLVLYYLESKTAQQVSEQLRLSVSTVEGRLKRGRKELRLRLARRGIGLSVALAALSLTPSVVTAAQMETLVGNTIHAGLSYTAGDPAGPLFTHEAARLAAQETIAMTLTTTTATLTAVLLIPLALTFSNHGTTETETAPLSPVISTTRQEVQEAAPIQLSPATQLAQVRPVHDPGLQRILVALEDSTELDYFDAPLSDAIDYIGQQHNIPVEIDEAALKDAGIPTDEPVRYKVKGAKLRIALDQMLGPLKLDYIVGNEGLTITTLARVEGQERESDAITVSAFMRDGEPAIRIEAGAESTVMTADKLRLLLPDLISEVEPKAPSATYATYEGADESSVQLETTIESDAGVVGSITVGGNVLHSGDQPSRKWHLKYQPESVQRIEAALESPTQLEFVDTPLADAVDVISQQHSVTILIDVVALADVGVPADEPINLIIGEIKLESALNLMLRNLDLDYTIRDEVLTITSAEVAQEVRDTRVYDLRQLPNVQGESLAEIIMSSTPGTPWEDIDGSGGKIAMFEDGMVVTQTHRGHRQIVDLLEQLLRHAEADDTARQHSSAGTGLDSQLPEVPWSDREKTAVMYDIRELIERYDGIDAASDEIAQRAKPLGVKWGGGIMAEHLIAVTTPEQHRVLREIIDHLLNEEAE